MPEAMERALKAKAREKGLKGDRADAYVYGTMRKTGWKPKREKDTDKNGNWTSKYHSVKGR